MYLLLEVVTPFEWPFCMFGEKGFRILDLRSVDLLNTARVRANILPLESEVFLAQKVSKLLKLFVVWLTFIVDEVFFWQK